MDKYIVVKIRKNVDGKRDQLQGDSYACNSPILMDKEKAMEAVTRLNEGASESKGFEEIRSAFAIHVGGQSNFEAIDLTRSIQSAQLHRRGK